MSRIIRSRETENGRDINQLSAQIIFRAGRRNMTSRRNLENMISNSCHEE